MNQLTLHSATEAAQQEMDDLLVTASAGGDYVTGKPGLVLLVVRNRLKRKSRAVTVTWEPVGEHTITIGPGKDYILGPFGLTDLHGGIVAEDEIRVEVTYPDSDGLEIFASVPPQGERITRTTPVQWFEIPR